MRPLAAVERFFERLFERPTARLFRTRLQPVQLQQRIERAMEAERRADAGRTVVPNRFRVHLSPVDLAAFAPIATTLAVELADAALAFARQHRYALLDRPEVRLAADDRLPAGEIEVDASFGAPAADTGALESTMAFTVPEPLAPRAILRELRPDGTDRTVLLDGRPLSIGRADDNDLMLTDPQVSRHHARIQARRGSLVLTDLGSSNGTWVDRIRIDEVALGIGDRIEIGETLLMVEASEASGADEADEAARGGHDPAASAWG